MPTLEPEHPCANADAALLERGAIVKAAPAIFPDGYTKCPEFKGREWICAIRSCRRCYKTASSLSRHARVRGGDIVSSSSVC